MKRLYLCEKASQARDIARVLGAKTKREGYTEGTEIGVTWCFGHLLEMASPDDYDPELKRWSLHSLPIVPNRWRMKVRRDARKQLDVIKRLLKQAGEIVISTDADREGEAIAREILDLAGWRGPIYRLWLSALDDASIRKALAGIRPGEQTEALYRAALARQRADWLVGMNLSRAYTCAARAAGHEGVLSVGRVQTPTLKLVVDRDRSIEDFKPVDYYDVLANFQVSEGEFTGKWRVPEDLADPEGRCLRRGLAEQVVERIRGKSGRIAAHETKKVKEPPPLPFDLSSLQLEASKRYGMGAQEVLDTAQSLYETRKATTYPRTDCPYLPESQHPEVSGVLEALGRSVPEARTLIDGADPDLKSRAWNESKITAHHAIIPTTASVDTSRFSEAEQQLFDLIWRRYLAQFYPDHEYDCTVVLVDVENDLFQANGRTERKPGWTVIYRNNFGEQTGEQSEDPENAALPRMTQGESAEVLAAETKARQTRPPSRFTEGTLIQAMKTVGKFVEDPRLKQRLKDTSGIGTEATRASIIETLFKRGFLAKKGKKRIVSTATGRALIDALPDTVKDPALTAVWEQALEEIAEGKRAFEEFVDRQAAVVGKLVESIKMNHADGNMEEIMGSDGGEKFPCPACEKPMRRRKGKKGWFWGCTGYPECTATLPDVKGKPGSRTERSTSAQASKPAGTCACGGEVRESTKAWQCEKCRTIVWKESFGKRLTKAQALSLLSGKTVHLNGLTNRAGKQYEADARIEDGKVKLVF